MTGAEGLVLLSNAVSLLQGVAALAKSFDEVSTIVSKRIAEGRLDWTMQERQQIMDAVSKARADAVSEVDKLP